MLEQANSTQFGLISPEATSLNITSAMVPVEQISSKKTQELIDAMLAIANGKQGNKKLRTMVGLAAVQIGVNRRVIIVDVASTGMGEKPQLRVFINPIITSQSSKTEAGREGCFSTGNVCGIVQRPVKITVEAYDREGKFITEKYNGFTARVVQHEVDHLEGIRFPDRITEDSDLHWVQGEEFGNYREHWQNWPTHCARSTWESIKLGQ